MRKRPFLHILLWLVAVGLLVWVVSTVPLAETWDVLCQLRFWQVGALVLANGVVLLLLNGRWWFILHGLGYSVPYLTLTGHRLAAFGVSYFTPGPQFGGEPVQVILVEREHAVPRSVAVTAVALDKTLELLVNFTFLFAGIILMLQEAVFGAVLGVETAVFAILLLLFPTTFLITTWAGWRLVSRLWRIGRRLPVLHWRSGWLAVYDRAGTAVQTSEDQATRFCRERPLPLALALLVSMASWAALVGEYYLMLSFLGISVTAVQTIIVITAARIAFLLPLPGGLGTLEASQLLVFSALGLNLAAGISVSLLIRARDLILGGIGLWWGSKRLRTTLKKT